MSNSHGYTVLDLVDRHADNRRSRDSVAFRVGNDTLTFGQLKTRYRCIAANLARIGVSPGDRVALHMENSLEWVELFFGAIAAGAVVVPINVMLHGPDLNRVIAVARPDMLVVDRAHAGDLSALKPMPRHLVSVGGSADDVPATWALAHRSLLEARTETPTIDLDPTAPAMMYFTSGTSGLPKGVIHTHNTILWNSLHQMGDMDITAAERFLVVPSFTWSAGLHDMTLATIWAGGQACLLTPCSGDTLDRIVDSVCDLGITRTLLVPTLLKKLLIRPDLLARLRESTLHQVISGAEPLYRQTVEALTRELPGVAVTQAYGMSEFPLMVTCATPEDARTHPASAGRVSSLATLAVRTPEGEIADQGAGEIVFRSPATTPGYLDDPERTAQAFRDGWFHTGDLGEIDADGYLTITGGRRT